MRISVAEAAELTALFNRDVEGGFAEESDPSTKFPVSNNRHFKRIVFDSII